MLEITCEITEDKTPVGSAVYTLEKFPSKLLEFVSCFHYKILKGYNTCPVSMAKVAFNIFIVYSNESILKGKS